MLLLNLIKLALLVVVISFFPTKKIILVATFLLPFQQAFTLNIAGTLRISDILYVSALVGLVIKLLLKKINCGLKQNIKSYIKRLLEKLKQDKGLIIKILLKKIKYNFKQNPGIIYFVYLALGSCIIGFLLKKDIRSGLATLGNYNQSRLLVNLFTPIMALMIFVIGNYAGRQNKDFFQKILQIWAKALTILSIYVIIQFVVINITGRWIKIPGEVLNYYTSFAYGIRRPWGFSIEPGALGNFLFFSFIFILIFLKKSKLQRNTIMISSIAVLLSFSSIAIFSIVTLWILLILKNWNNFKTRNKVLFISLIVVSIIIALTNSTVYNATIGKVVVENQSKMDRQTNIQILTRMFIKYPVFGVGSGNYGALRNLFSKGTLFPLKDFYDMPNVFYYGMLGEQGIVGVVLFLLFVKKLWRSAKVLKISPAIWLIPLAVLIFTASTITFDYMAFGFGLIIGQAKYLKKEIIVEDRDNGDSTLVKI